MKNLPSILFYFILCLVFFYQIFSKGLLPIPSDTIVGLYHPFRDSYAKNYPNGIPFKNFLITDPVRQQYPWKNLVISAEKKLSLPLWNPYNFAGTPLLANFQSAAFYPINILFFILPFNVAWSLLIFLQPLLAGVFIYLYLDNLKLSKLASLLGSITFSFSGFFITWLEWGNVLHTAIWLPFVLLSIDKIVSNKGRLSVWNVLFVLSLAFSFFAGYLQTFFYLFTISFFYFLGRLIQSGKDKKILIPYLMSIGVFVFLTSIQWIPTLQFILLSARDIDVVGWKAEGWFIPWKHLIQFVVPDFFGNPSTLNYFGVWNYGELTGYAGITPLVFTIFAVIFRRDRKTLFFGLALLLSLVFALPNSLSKSPFVLNVPFINTSQPTRLLFITDFSIAVLAALGFDYFRKKNKGMLYVLSFMSLTFVCLWSFITFGGKYFLPQDLIVSRSNLVLPTAIFIASLCIIVASGFLKKISNKFFELSLFFIIILVSFDLLRFGLKFNTFAPESYLYPKTSAIDFLQKNTDNFRIMTSDSRILPPNFSAIYGLQSVDGYDPLYLKNYAQLIAASERGKPNINSPFGFNRIITPHNYSSQIINLMGVKYIISLDDINKDNFIKVFEEGQTKIYENKNVYPRIFFVKNIILAKNREEAVMEMFKIDSFKENAVIEEEIGIKNFGMGSAKIISYEENRVEIKTESKEEGFLILTDSFYPTWEAQIDGKKTHIYLTNVNFRGVIVPAGKHRIEFINNLF